MSFLRHPAMTPALGVMGFVALVLMLHTNARAQETSWDTYTNPRYGFSIDLPRHVFEDANRSDNGDGISLSGLGGRATLLVFGYNNVMDETPADIANTPDGDLPDAKVTYRRVTKRWGVVSGFATIGGEQRVFYTRFQANADLTQYSTFRLTYPVAIRTLFDPLVGRLSKSLTAPR